LLKTRDKLKVRLAVGSTQVDPPNVCQILQILAVFRSFMFRALQHRFIFKAKRGNPSLFLQLIDNEVDAVGL